MNVDTETSPYTMNRVEGVMTVTGLKLKKENKCRWQKGETMDSKECDELKQKRCKKCNYVGSCGSSGEVTCDYILITGHMRNSSFEDCDKYLPRTGKRPKTQPVCTRSARSIRTRRSEKSKTHFGKRFSSELDKLRMSDSSVAAMLGMSRYRVGALARGDFIPRSEECDIIAEKFNVRPEELHELRNKDLSERKGAKSNG